MGISFFINSYFEVEWAQRVQNASDICRLPIDEALKEAQFQYCVERKLAESPDQTVNIFMVCKMCAYKKSRKLIMIGQVQVVDINIVTDSLEEHPSNLVVFHINVTVQLLDKVLRAGVTGLCNVPDDII